MTDEELIDKMLLCSSDSLLVVNQIKGVYKVKQPHLKPLCEEAKKLLSEKKATLNWISREENLAGKHFE